MPGSVEAVKDRAGDCGELVDLLRTEPVKDQAPDLLPVAGCGCRERREAGRAVGAGQIAWSDPVLGNKASVIDLSTSDGEQPSRIMVYSGQPIGQPVAMGGPFVMNTHAEITQAFSDFRGGKFGDIPRQARLRYL